MAKYRKLGRTSSQRKALLRSQVTALIENGKIVTTEARAKEVRKQAEKLITLAVKEKDNYETVTVSAKVAKKDADGKRVKEVVDGKKVTVYETVEKEIKKDLPSKLHARKQMDKVLYKVTEVPRGCTPDKTLYPRTAGIQSTDITKRLTNEALFLLQLNKSIVIAIIFSYTAITVDNAANAINIKNNTSHITPPGIWLNTLGRVMNNNDGPAPGLIP